MHIQIYGPLFYVSKCCCKLVYLENLVSTGKVWHMSDFLKLLLFAMSECVCVYVHAYMCVYACIHPKASNNYSRNEAD